MSKRSVDQDLDLQLSVVAMQRAALRAREIARQTGTCIVVSNNGAIRLLDPNSPELDVGAALAANPANPSVSRPEPLR